MKLLHRVSAPVIGGLMLAALAGPASASVQHHAVPPTTAATAQPFTPYGPYYIEAASDSSYCIQAHGVGSPLTTQLNCTSHWTMHSNSTTGHGKYYFMDGNGNCAYEKNTGSIVLKGYCSSSVSQEVWGEGASGTQVYFSSKRWGDLMSVPDVANGSELVGGNTNDFWHWYLLG